MVVSIRPMPLPAPGRAARERAPSHRWTPAEDQAVIAGYQTRTLAAIAAELGLSNGQVASRSRVLAKRGLLNPRTRFWQPRWTKAEREYLVEHRGDLTDAQLARKLGRTETAIAVRGKRAGIGCKSQWLTARQVGEILGIDSKKAVWLAEQGALRLQKSVVRAGASVAWRCEIAELERFLRCESQWYDPKRITDEPWRGMARKAHADPWLNARQAARLVGLCTGGLHRYLTQGEIPAIRIKGCGRYQWRIRRSALAGFSPKRPELVGHRGRGKRRVAA